ncbi:MAG: ankyrin repeat domain-containing protein [Psychrobium sp.]|nr:ankyrin repeat domain-containing protein [Psychrobium sp.]
MYAVQFEYLEVMEKLLASGANTNLTNVDQWTALHLTVDDPKNTTERTLRAMNTLIKHGANVNAQQKSGYTSLHFTVFNDLSSLFSQLLDAGVDHKITNHKGETPLMIAEQYQRQVMLKTLNSLTSP